VKQRGLAFYEAIIRTANLMSTQVKDNMLRVTGVHMNKTITKKESK
jgi:hypothetical protein